MSDGEQQLNDCGCCEGIKSLTPASVENLPGLSALAYRVGTHGGFKTTMQAALSGEAALRELTTREDDDPAIATLDGWATILDVLSFYQERIANEGYLRTATERRSILEMARSIGYELRPGVAAGTFLAFKLETAPGAPLSAKIPTGTKAQSTPAQDETPQTFETTEDITGYAAWNELKARQTESVLPKLGLKTFYLKGTATNLKAGDTILIIGDERAKGAGKESNENWDFRRVSSVIAVASIDPDQSYTIITLNQGLGSFIPHVDPAKKNPRIYALRQRAFIFGYNAAEWKALPDVTKASYLGVSDPANLTAEQKAEWPRYTIYVSKAAVQAVRPLFKLVPVEPEAETVFEAAKAAAEQAANKLSEGTGPAAWNAAQIAIKAINSVLNSLWTALSKYESTGHLTDPDFGPATQNLADALKELVAMPGGPDLGNLSDALKKMTEMPPDPGDFATGLATLIEALGKISAYLKTPPLTFNPNNLRKIIENLNAVLKSVDPLRRSLTALVASDITAITHATGSAVSAAEFAAGKLTGAVVAREAAAFITFVMKASLTLPLRGGKTRLAQVADDGCEAAGVAVDVVQAETEGGALTAMVVLSTMYPGLIPVGLALFVAAKLTKADQKQAVAEVSDAVIAAIKQARTPTEVQERQEPVLAVHAQAPSDTRFIDLDTLYPRIVSGRGWLVLSSPKYQEVYSIESAVEAGRAEFAISSKTTRLQIKGENFDRFEDGVRSVNAYADSEELEFAERPITAAVSGIELLLNSKVEGLIPNQLIAITGTDSNTGDAIAEIATIDRVEDENGYTKLVLKAPLANSYVRDSAVINANVARATHGDTKNEVLGSGDGSKSFQKFQLKQNPLTFVSAPTSSGGQTTLEVRVNDVLWREDPSFYELPPNQRAYVTRIADDGKVTVQFGDSITGARVPTGSENVTAKYRVGIGSSGMLASDQINLLMSRPLGVKDVTNPTAPTGAEDPEQLDQARQNAPLTVLTLDRIVSLQDFEDFARAFSGIGKAQATWLWNGETRMIHLTVAGIDGGDVPPISALYRNLVAAIDAARHTDHTVRIDSFTARLFDLAAKILIDPDYLFEDVKTAVEKALADAFSFDTRSFGQAVTASEVSVTAQAVAGVVAVDLDKLYFDGTAAVSDERLPANTAHWEGNQIKPAELLTVNPNGISLTEMK